MIIELFPSGPLLTNAFLLGSSITKEGVIIDAPFESCERILESAQQHGLTIKMILFTHSHWDHIADAYLLKEATKAPLFIHKEDAKNLHKPGSDQVPCPFPILGVETSHYLQDQQILPLGEFSILVIHTPGHTPGGCCFYLDKQGILFSGDTLFKGCMGRLDLATGQKNRMEEALKKLATLPLNTKVYPGHGEVTTIEAESWIQHPRERFQF